MFALVPSLNNPISDQDRLSEIDVANENQRDHSAYVSEFAATDAYDRLFSFIQSINQSCIKKTLTSVQSQVETAIKQSNDQSTDNQWALFCQSLVQMLDSMDQIIDAHPAISRSSGEANNQSLSMMSRFGNAAFRDFLSELSTKSHQLIKDVINKATEQSNNPSIKLPVVSRQRLSLKGTAPRGASSQSTNQSNKPSIDQQAQSTYQSNHIHLPKNVPQKVIDSLIARGELPPGYVHNPPTESDGHSHNHSHGEPCNHDHPSSASDNQSSTQLNNQSNIQSVDQHVDDSSIDRSERVDRWCDLINHYLMSSFGDARRIDYGTGHEMNFACCMFAFGALYQSVNPSEKSSSGPFSGMWDRSSSNASSDSLNNQSTSQSTNETINQPTSQSTDPQNNQSTDQSIDQTNDLLFTGFGLYVFPRYVTLMRRLQKLYLLEPAGTRGVWGLDDYCFLPFLFGSAQLIDHPRLRPKSVTSKDMLEYCKDDYLYFQSIQFILDVKTASFAEHSPMLNDMTILKDWKMINQGLMRMYQGEILHKYPIIQHFIFTDVLSQRLIKKVQIIDVKAPDICCSDSIRFPSAIAAKGTT